MWVFVAAGGTVELGLFPWSREWLREGVRSSEMNDVLELPKKFSQCCLKSCCSVAEAGMGC